MMKNYKFTINGNQYSVDISLVENNLVHMEVNGTHYDVEINRALKVSKTPVLLRSEVSKGTKQEIDRKEGGSAFPVPSPLPGLILEIYVKPGDILKQGQKLLSMEAMKMINYVLSEKDGVVEKIMVMPGQNVLQGDTLLEIV